MIVKLANRPSLVLMVGPFFLLLTLLLAIFHLGAGALYLPLLCAVGLSCIALFAHRGLYLAWGVIAALMPFYHSPWEMGAAVSISLGLWIAHLAIGQFEKGLEDKTSQTGARETELTEKLQVIQEQFEIASLETERWLKQYRLQKSDGESLQQRHETMFSDLMEAQRKVEQQRQELNEVRTARLEASLEAKSYLAALKNAQEELSSSAEQLEEGREAARKLRQLQEQFEERNEMIHQVRKELWQSESQVLYFKGLSWEEERSCDATHEALVADLAMYEEKEQELEKEKAALEMLVSSLISELKGRSVPSFAPR
ncbi:MAG: hypothetical protein JSR80_00925 [Verrucomicrobia bacterium]|nr:hypothetical protein [Verrucomicrobiota bacterium]